MGSTSTSPPDYNEGPSSSLNYDFSFKILLIGDSSVGKSSLLLSFISSDDNNATSDLTSTPTTGVDFKIKYIDVEEKRVKLKVWDTAGQEKYGALIQSYYRGAHGVILVYDVTRRDSFTSLEEHWAKELELYSTNKECVKIVVGNKLDKEQERAVSREEGLRFGQRHSCLFLECSARTKENVESCFKELTLKILEVPSLAEEGHSVVERQHSAERHARESHQQYSSCCCSN